MYVYIKPCLKPTLVRIMRPRNPVTEKYTGRLSGAHAIVGDSALNQRYWLLKKRVERVSKITNNFKLKKIPNSKSN